MFLAPEARSTPALDWAARAAEPLALVAFGLLVLRWRRVAIGVAALAVVAWLARYVFCCPCGFLPGYYAWLAGMILLGAAAWVTRVPLGRVGGWSGRISIALTLMAVMGAVAWHVLRTGPVDVAAYPARGSSAYRLPFAAGVSRLCTQGNRGAWSHYGWQEYAYDFAMPVGSDVLAARGGRVTTIDVSHDGHGTQNNVLVIDHGDGTFGYYLHLMRGGSYVRVGQGVRQGERIAASGDVGYSTSPHLHFHVVRPDAMHYPWMVRVSFADVVEDAGIPRTLRRYTSSNGK